MRIDGLDNIEIPATISISPSANDTLTDNSCSERKNCQLTYWAWVLMKFLPTALPIAAYYDEDTLTTHCKDDQQP